MLSNPALCALFREHGASQTVVELLRQHDYDAQLHAGHVTAVYASKLKNSAGNCLADASNFYTNNPNPNQATGSYYYLTGDSYG